jgi:hypothetical protein
MIIFIIKMSAVQEIECFSYVVNRKSESNALMTVLRKAQTEKRLTCGLFPAVKLLEMDPDRALFCIMPQSSEGNAALHIQTVLLQAFCYENDINTIQVHDRTVTVRSVLFLDSNRFKWHTV